MESKVTNRGKLERVVEVDVPEAELAPHFEKVYEKYRKGVRLEGFRKGKVPLGLIKKLYGDVIKGEAIDEVVQSVFKEVRQKENLRPVAPAKLEDVQYDEQKGLHFKALVEVQPEVELKTYTGLSVERELYQVEEEDVNRALDDVRERMAVIEPIEAEAEENHFVVADFQQVDATGIPIVGKKFEDRLVQLALDENAGELSEQLLGVRPSETRRVTLNMGEANGEAEPKKEFYQVQVKEVKVKKLPDLDDELAKDVGEFKTLDELKRDIKEKLVKQTEANAQRNMRQVLIDDLLKKNALELPEGMISNYLDAVIEGAKKDPRMQADPETLRSEYRATAIRNIKWELFKDKIAEIENISVNDDDKNEFIAKIAAARNIDEKEILKSLKSSEAKRRFGDDLLEEKVLDFLESHAKIKDRKVTRKDLEKRQKQVAV